MSNVARSIAFIRVLAFNLYKNVYFKIARLKRRAIFVYKRFYFEGWYDYTTKNVVALAGFLWFWPLAVAVAEFIAGRLSGLMYSAGIFGRLWPFSWRITNN